MSVFQGIILGVIQGLTEFLPISSSGHLIFVPRILGWADQGLAFDVVVHLGTLFALVWYLRKKLRHLLGSLFPSGHDPEHDKRLVLLIAAGTVPAVLAGFFADDWIGSAARSPVIVAVNLIVWGIVLWLADLYARAQIIVGKQKHISTLGLKNALLIGVAQALSLVPGTSRSGITITAGLFSRMDRRAATEFSFLMAVPIIALAGGAEIFALVRNGTALVNLDALVAGFAASAIGGLVAIWALIQVIQRWSFLPFAVYRILVGALILFFLI